jgi:hypothetical protein
MNDLRRTDYFDNDVEANTGCDVLATEPQRISRALEPDQIIINMEHPEWGTWRVLREYAPGIWEIRGNAGERILSESEFIEFWSATEIVPELGNQRLPTKMLDTLYDKSEGI